MDDDSTFPPEPPMNFRCMAIFEDEPMPRKHTRLNGSNLTIECPGCKRFWLVPRDKWPSKKSGRPLACVSCGIYVPSREWSLLHVPWLWVVA